MMTEVITDEMMRSAVRLSARHAMKLVEIEGGHVPIDTGQFFRETLTWYDTYLGPVK